ncbi:MAG: hypothetical protein JSV82_05365 [Planctomycetota bacterium]|nr:MAG: hypothetical protein JSV82_05365 [Planctomycetota bacterium]
MAISVCFAIRLVVRFLREDDIMSELEIVRELARESLTAAASTVELGAFLWERAQRLVRNAEYICQLPELGEAGLQVDRFCLVSAAYFSGAGLARYAGGKGLGAKSGLNDVNDDDLLELSVQVAEQKLAGAIEKSRIEKITRIITESGSYFTRMAEAMVLSDARNLDDMGLVGILNEYGRYICRGKGVSDILKSWQRKKDYRYWQARLEEGFRFPPVRKLAEQRLCTAEEFMDHLNMEAAGRDLEGLVVRSADGKISR